MNLETWYSGKCPSTIDSLTGSGNEGQYRGFSDIVLLDLITKVIPENPSLIITSDAAIPSLIKMLTSTFTNPPASSVNYLAHVNKNLQKARLVQPAYAQQQSAGFGFNKLLPILPVWEAMRNVAYTLFVLVFVVYGFMMMFRTKINPQTAINFELAIPKLVVTLLAITFSYAIAGFIIDLSVLIPAFLVSILENAKLINLQLPEFIVKAASGLNLDTNNMPMKYITGQTPIGGSILGLQVLTEIWFSTGMSYITSLMTGLPPLLFQVLFFQIGLLFKLILTIAFLYILFKIFLMVIQAYAMIVLNIIFAPIILLGNIFPGSNSFGNWVRGLLANISVFPSVLIMFMIAATFVGNSSPISNGEMWVPQYFWGSTGEGLLSFNSAKGVSYILAFGIIFLTPKVADMIRDALKAPAFKYGTAIGEALGKGYQGANVMEESGLMSRIPLAGRGAARALRGYKAVSGTFAKKPGEKEAGTFAGQ